MSNTIEPVIRELPPATEIFVTDVFSPKMQELFVIVGSQLKDTNSVEPNVATLYNKIAEVCTQGNNGTALLALAEAMMSLVSAAIKPADKGVPEITE